MADGLSVARHGADHCSVIAVLHEVLAIELVCVLRYKSQHYRGNILEPGAVANKFLAYAAQEQVHLGLVAKRIVALGGAANLALRGLHTRSHAEFDACNSLEDMISDNLVAERVAVSTYTEVVYWLGTSDLSTRRLMEGLLADEEAHADDLTALLAHVGSTTHARRSPPLPRLHRSSKAPGAWAARNDNAARTERSTRRG